jgi:hypothetical protein
MTAVYLVIASGGEYEDSWERIERVFFDEKTAVEFMGDKNEELERLKEIEKLKDSNHYTDEQQGNMSYDEFLKKCVTDYTLLEQDPYRIQIINVE